MVDKLGLEPLLYPVELLILKMVGKAGLEPASLVLAADFKSAVYANSTTSPYLSRLKMFLTVIYKSKNIPPKK